MPAAEKRISDMREIRVSKSFPRWTKLVFHRRSGSYAAEHMQKTFSIQLFTFWKLTVSLSLSHTRTTWFLSFMWRMAERAKESARIIKELIKANGQHRTTNGNEHPQHKIYTHLQRVMWMGISVAQTLSSIVGWWPSWSARSMSISYIGISNVIYEECKTLFGHHWITNRLKW